MMKQLTTISSQQLFSQLRQNALLITVNNRLARRYADDYNQWMSSESQSVVWPSARILPLNTWLTLQFQSLQDSGLTDLSVLDGFSEKKLWEDIISTEAEKNFMMKASAIARLVMQAWSLMKQWQIPLSELSGFLTLESQSLKHWSEKFELACRRKKLTSPVLLPDLISQALSDKQLPCEEQIVFAGFEDPNKLHDCLTDSLEAAGTSVTQLKQDSINQQLVVEKYADTKSEVTAAASWAKSKLLANPDQKLAIVIPNLNENRPWIQTLFNQILHPERTLPPPYQNMDLFNFSLGIALTDYPLVHDALLTLELIKPGISLDTLSKILNAQYLFGEPANGPNALVQKTSVDLILRKHGRLNWSLDDLIAFCKSHQANHSSIQFEDWISRLETLQSIAAVLKNRQTPESLSRLFLNIWQAMGWPGNKTLNSHEYQQSEKLLQLLQDFQHLKQVNHTLSSTEAIRLFKQLASETIYQEQSEQPPLLISGLLEAAGQQFDALWLSGLDDQTLPQQTPPNPLIPLSLQKTYDVPHSSAEREFNYAQQLLDHFIANAVDLVISYPTREQDKELRASSLLSKFEHIDKSDNETSIDVAISECLPDLDPDIDPTLDPDLENESSLTALPEHYPAHGGSSTLTSQAQCPFKAAALFRLNASEPETPGDGVSALDRGTQIHRALELLWQEIKSQQQLLSLSLEALQTLIIKTLDKVLFAYQNRRPDLYSPEFLKIEKQRQLNLLLEWFELEKQRLKAFKVVGTEQKNTIEVGGLLLKTQADRIDELNDGRRIIIDYKTGSSASSRSWQEEAILEPQLPLYSLAEDEKLAALALAQVNEKACQFNGLANDENLLPGVNPVTQKDLDTENSWHHLRENWRTQLAELAVGFRSGSVDINPYNCQFCQLEYLCRKHEVTGDFHAMEDSQ